METIETVDVYINKVLALTNQMKTIGETHLKKAKVEKILMSLTPRFEHVVAAIEETNDISTMIVGLLSGSLRAHEQRMNDNKIEKPIEQALQAQVSIGSSYHKHGSSRGRGLGRGGQNMEALSKTTLVPITIQVQITLSPEDMVTTRSRRTKRHV